ncbi:MAG TPA: aminotransferase class V-fold PLP-dependent enzyme [Solirubrobacteraceae bacterium]|jgi:L-cysteine/cystine lyase|nr:aminotransferase class V-fold PLP-dependent enzyme [Solirubrobacteraceae bacterium]
MDAAGLRAAFSVFDRYAYLNAGTCGPVPQAAVDAVREVLAGAAANGRGAGYYEALGARRAALRSSYAELLGAHADDVALTTSTSEGVVRVLGALELAPGDEVLTSDEEHPGLQGPLAAARARRGIALRAVPFAQIAAEVRPETRLIACSHVSWISGRVVGDLSDVADVPVLLDGAQGVGAVPTDPTALGCSFYAGSGQKWLCGPVGSGMLWTSPRWRDRLPAIGPTYLNLAEPAAGLAAVPRADAARLDASAQSLETITAADAAIGVLRDAGWTAVHERAAALACDLAAALAAAGRDVMPRSDTTLISWKDADPAATRARLAAAGVLIRDLPGTGLLRASVGAWNDETDLDRLLSALTA